METPERGPGAARSDLLFALALAAVCALGLWLRVEDLAIKPLHHDESVNGWFTLRLDWWNIYKYRPADYHGPLLYYINLFFFTLLGPTEVALRLGTVIAGAFMPLALWPLRDHLGRVGGAIAGLLLAVSPGLVYFARTNIHETYLVLFTLMWVGLATRWFARPTHRVGVAAAAVCALAFATKETVVISGACLIAGWGLALLAGRARGPHDLFAGRSLPEVLRSLADTDRRTLKHASVAFGVILLVLFSSFFTYWYGVGGFFQAFLEWTKHGVGGRNQAKSWDYFWTVSEWTLLWLPYAGLGAAVLAAGLRHRFGLFLVGWTVASAVVYSVIPYKTPWCGLNIDLPLILLVAWGANHLWTVARRGGAPMAARVGVALLVPVPLGVVPEMVEQVREVNADRYDDDDVPYVFVQTQRGIFECVDYLLDVERTRPGRTDGQGPRVVNYDAKNPLRWYTLTRGWDYNRTEYVHDDITEDQLADARVVITTSKHHTVTEAAVEASGEWHLERCRLRPGHRVSVWWRAEDWAAFEVATSDGEDRGGPRAPERRGPPPPGPVFVPPKP